MKVLLVIPINRTYVVMPSLGLGYVASTLREAGHSIEILHCIKEKYSYEDFERHLKTHKYDLIGYQMFTYDVNSIIKHVEIAKAVNGNMLNVLGGYHPSGDPLGVLDTVALADYALASEVELAFSLFLEELGKSKPNFSAVPNLIWRNEEGTIQVNPIRLVEDLDTIPFPAWDLMDPRGYPESPHGGFVKSFPTAPLIITRGCPMKCTFCSGKSITTDHLRRRSIGNVIEEIKFLREHYGVNDFLIEDENITHHKKFAREFCETLIEQKLNINWSCPSGVRLDTLDLNLLKLMEQSGCYSLSVGVEFGSQRIHDLTKKNLSINTITEKLELFKHVNIQTTGFFLMGIPGETKEEMLQTIRFAKKLRLDRAQFNNFMPLPGSELYTQLKQKIGQTFDYDHYFVHDVGYVPEGMTRSAMKALQRKAYMEFYFRPKIIIKLLKQIISLKQLMRLVNRFIDALH